MSYCDMFAISFFVGFVLEGKGVGCVENWFSKGSLIAFLQCVIYIIYFYSQYFPLVWTREQKQLFSFK